MSVIVRTKSGALQGIQTLLDNVTAFLGVRYAAPPVGILRWRPPRPASQWSGTRAATRAAPRCIQHAPYGELEPDNQNLSEDCLCLNVWTPSVAPGAMLPVIFWIHGGEFFAGSGSEPRYNGASLAARGAVVVTINHRLGLFGFLSHPELSAESRHGVSGNYGLLDQIAALHWVRENIDAFGGNPNCITIAGESAGSCSVSALMASPLARGLFDRALGQSCAYFMPEPNAMKPLPHGENEQRGAEFMRAAGAHSLSQLRAMSAERLQQVWLKDPTKRFQPCIDNHVLPNVDAVFAAGQQAKVPLLVGWNADEMGFLRATREKFEPSQFRQSVTRAFDGDAAVLLAAFESCDELETAVVLSSARAMVYPTWKWAEQHSNHAPVFVYQFDRVPPGNEFGATHACEIEYVFGTLGSKPRNYLTEDHSLSRRIGDYWVNFARTGDPNGENLADWPAFGPAKKILYLDSNAQGGPLRDRDRFELLDAIYERRGLVRGFKE